MITELERICDRVTVLAGRPGDLTKTGIRHVSALPAAASGRRLARRPVISMAYYL